MPDPLGLGFDILSVKEFVEGKLRRRLYRVVMRKHERRVDNEPLTSRLAVIGLVRNR